jgi:RNA polymerase sigma factor (sigma-70 family)
MDDQQIITSIRTGSSDLALNALYRHFPMIRQMVRSKGGSARDAEDIFQEALIILIRQTKSNDFQLTAQLSTYLFSVCRFLWKDQLKKTKPHLPFDGDTGLTQGDSGLTQVQEQELYSAVEQEGRARLAEKVLQELKDRCREILLFFYQDHLSLRDIATRMGYSSENTAKNQKYKCLEAARNRLKELTNTTSTF